MPRPSSPRLALAGPVLLALAAAGLGPSLAAGALAAAAASVLEAAPFVFVAERLAASRRTRALAAFAGLAGCGCGGRMPGALALAAIALCWFAFGPAATLARTVVACALLARSRSARGAHAPDDGDPFATLAAVGTSAAATALVLAAAGDRLATLSATAGGRAVGAVAGALLGIVAPCATAAVAIAAALAPHAPYAAAGVLATGGLLRLPRVPWRSATGAHVARATTVATICSRLAVAGSLAWLAWHGLGGFVNPRARPALAFGALVGLANVRRPAGRALGPAVGALTLAALLAGSPVPQVATTATTVADAYPGERLTFAGRVRAAGSATLVERFTITCCRADASVESVRVGRRLPLADGSWVVVRGTLRAVPGGPLVLDDDDWRPTPTPVDPFAYR